VARSVAGKRAKSTKKAARPKRAALSRSKARIQPKTKPTPRAKAGRPIELYYWPTGNGRKILIFLEEVGAPYEIKPVNIGKGDQFKPEFLRVRPRIGMVELTTGEAS